MYEHIKFAVADSIATITIDRQASNNALSAQMFRDLISAVEHCDADDTVKVVIVTGAGKNFSAGGDIKEMASFDFISYELSMLTGQTSLETRHRDGERCGSGSRLRDCTRCGLPHHDGGELSPHGLLECRASWGYGLYLSSASDCRTCQDD